MPDSLSAAPTVRLQGGACAQFTDQPQGSYGLCLTSCILEADVTLAFRSASEVPVLPTLTLTKEIPFIIV